MLTISLQESLKRKQLKVDQANGRIMHETALVYGVITLCLGERCWISVNEPFWRVEALPNTLNRGSAPLPGPLPLRRQERYSQGWVKHDLRRESHGCMTSRTPSSLPNPRSTACWLPGFGWLTTVTRVEARECGAGQVRPENDVASLRLLERAVCTTSLPRSWVKTLLFVTAVSQVPTLLYTTKFQKLRTP